MQNVCFLTTRLIYLSWDRQRKTTHLVTLDSAEEAPLTPQLNETLEREYFLCEWGRLLGALQKLLILPLVRLSLNFYFILVYQHLYKGHNMHLQHHKNTKTGIQTKVYWLVLICIPKTWWDLELRPVYIWHWLMEGHKTKTIFLLLFNLVP